MCGAAVLVQAREKGWFTATHHALWAAARAKHVDPAGTRLRIKVLLHRGSRARWLGRMRHVDVVVGVRVSLESGSISPDVVAIEAGTGTGKSPPAHLAGIAAAEAGFRKVKPNQSAAQRGR